MYEDFVATLRNLIRPDRFDRAIDLAERYWSTDGEQYTGRVFHELSDAAHPNEITAQDLVAVSTLSVTVPPRVAIWLLSEDGKASVGELLTEVPTDKDIWESSTLLTKDRELWRLWELLNRARWPTHRPNNRMGRTTISKLLACKRPRLVPIWDSVLETLFGPVGNYWEAYRRALSDEALRLELSVASSGHAPEGAGLLRRMDALLWMIGHEDNW